MSRSTSMKSGKPKPAKDPKISKDPKEEVLGKVLVVEDDAILAMMIEDALRDAGATQVTLCGTTQQALESLRAEKPDAMVLDVHLADRDDGWAIAELVGQVGPTPPRIVFSTGAPQDIPEDVAQMGVVLTKPYAPEELVAAVKKPRRPGLLARFRKSPA